MNWGRSEQTLALVEEARAARRGRDDRPIPLHGIAYRYRSALFPPWAARGRHARRCSSAWPTPINEHERAQDVAARIELDRGGGDPKNVQFAGVRFRPTRSTARRSPTLPAAPAARSTSQNAAETAIEIQEKGGCNATVYHAIGEEDVRSASWRTRPRWSPPTAASCRFGAGVSTIRATTGRSRACLATTSAKLGVISLEEAIRKMTSLPAGRLGLVGSRADCGLGLKADLVVFDPETIADKAEFGDPHHYPEGIEYVVVNGVLVVDNGEVTGNRPGAVLLGPGDE